MTREAVVEIHGLVAGYGRHPVLRQLDLTVWRGEALGIAGNNGAGKTTLLKLILGLIAPQDGRISVLGKILDSPRVRRLMRCQIGYVPQLHTPGKMPVSVHDAILMGRWGKGFGFFRKAFIAAFLSGAGLSLLGVVILNLNLTTIRFALMHIALLGADIAMVLGFPPLVGAIAGIIIASLLLGPAGDFLNMNTGVSGVLFMTICPHSHAAPPRSA